MPRKHVIFRNLLYFLQLLSRLLHLGRQLFLSIHRFLPLQFNLVLLCLHLALELLNLGLHGILLLLLGLFLLSFAYIFELAFQLRGNLLVQLPHDGLDLLLVLRF